MDRRAYDVAAGATTLGCFPRADRVAGKGMGTPGQERASGAGGIPLSPGSGGGLFLGGLAFRCVCTRPATVLFPRLIDLPVTARHGLPHMPWIGPVVVSSLLC
jgi:hypothetical protein